jgi:hypothetical protein
MNHKTNILKIIFILSAFFCVSFVSAATLIGSVDLSKDNKVKVCRDVTCSNPIPGTIDFNTSDGSPLVIDKDKNISGKAWGGDLGWITFNPPYGGVFFADLTTGLLKGTAWSETSGAINFSVTGQKVIIDLVTGEWNGWAWVSGPYSGWIKFDCKVASCVHTIWRTPPDVEPPQKDSIVSPTPVIAEVKNQMPNNFNTVINTVGQKINDFINSAIRITGDTYNYLFSYLINLRNSVLNN